jgi:hypothetical protein
MSYDFGIVLGELWGVHNLFDENDGVKKNL